MFAFCLAQSYLHPAFSRCPVWYVMAACWSFSKPMQQGLHQVLQEKKNTGWNSKVVSEKAFSDNYVFVRVNVYAGTMCVEGHPLWDYTHSHTRQTVNTTTAGGALCKWEQQGSELGVFKTLGLCPHSSSAESSTETL